MNRCGSCHGSGKVTCFSCGGRRYRPRLTGSGDMDMSACVACGGKGAVRCSTCGGQGTLGPSGASQWVGDDSAEEGLDERLLAACTAARLDETLIEILVEHGADVNARDKSNKTPLILAAQAGHARAVRTLLKLGADVNAADDDGVTALIAAAAHGANRLVLGPLLEAGANVNAQARNGATPLFHAALRGNNVAVQLLLQHRADPTLKTLDGDTPLMAARRVADGERRAKVISLLNEASGERVVIRCPQCRVGLRLPAGKIGTVKCPNCKSTFTAET